MLPNRVQELQSQGSPTYEHLSAIIVVGATEWVSVSDRFPASRTYAPLDSMEVINNSAQPINVLLNSQAEFEVVPAYMIKPFLRKPIRQFGMQNAGIANTVAGDIICHLKRLKPDIQVVANASTVR